MVRIVGPRLPSLDEGVAHVVLERVADVALEGLDFGPDVVFPNAEVTLEIVESAGVLGVDPEELRDVPLNLANCSARRSVRFCVVNLAV